MSANTIRSTRPRGEIRRTQILDTAATVFLEHGYAGTTIELIVARAGASKGTIYSFFGNKEGLFGALIEERTDFILADFPDLTIDDVDVRAVLAAIASRYMDLVMSPDAIGLYRLILAEGARFPDLVKVFYRVGPDRVTTQVAEVLRLWARDGQIRVDDPVRVATQFLDAIRGELHLRVVAGLPPGDLPHAIRENILHAVETFWRALQPSSGR